LIRMSVREAHPFMPHVMLSRRTVLKALAMPALPGPSQRGDRASTKELVAAIGDYAEHRRIWIETWNARLPLPVGYEERNYVASRRLGRAFEAARLNGDQRTEIFRLIDRMTPKYTRGLLE
jgi:hypothetical protein